MEKLWLGGINVVTVEKILLLVKELQDLDTKLSASNSLDLIMSVLYFNDIINTTTYRYLQRCTFRMFLDNIRMVKFEKKLNDIVINYYKI